MRRYYNNKSVKLIDCFYIDDYNKLNISLFLKVILHKNY